VMYFATWMNQFVLNAATTSGGPTAGLIASLACSAVFGAVFAILVAVTYYELRSTKEGWTSSRSRRCSIEKIVRDLIAKCSAVRVTRAD
jgi:hypothetical protein